MVNAKLNQLGNFTIIAYSKVSSVSHNITINSTVLGQHFSTSSCSVSYSTLVLSVVLTPKDINGNTLVSNSSDTILPILYYPDGSIVELAYNSSALKYT